MDRQGFTYKNWLGIREGNSLSGYVLHVVLPLVFRHLWFFFP
uniref:Phosphatidate cytidylyltransferase n=1 Tax=Heterorhabditis bacteriophora TaxID=37862 RepID=A0A1I7XMM0_HETBA